MHDAFVEYFVICCNLCACRSYVLLKVVEKTKKCLDFSITVVFIHMIACTMYEVMLK